MQKKKLIGAAALSLAIAGGGVAGAMFGSPLSSGAQEQTTTTNGTGDAGTSTAPDPGDPPGAMRMKHDGAELDAPANDLGITTDELRTELKAGKTISAVAGEHNVSVDTV